jgi:hypothetical protein
MQKERAVLSKSYIWWFVNVCYDSLFSNDIQNIYIFSIFHIICLPNCLCSTNSFLLKRMYMVNMQHVLKGKGRKMWEWGQTRIYENDWLEWL